MVRMANIRMLKVRRIVHAPNAQALIEEIKAAGNVCLADPELSEKIENVTDMSVVDGGLVVQCGKKGAFYTGDKRRNPTIMVQE